MMRRKKLVFSKTQENSVIWLKYLLHKLILNLCQWVALTTSRRWTGKMVGSFVWTHRCTHIMHTKFMSSVIILGIMNNKCYVRPPHFILQGSMLLLHCGPEHGSQTLNWWPRESHIRSSRTLLCSFPHGPYNPRVAGQEFVMSLPPCDFLDLLIWITWTTMFEASISGHIIRTVIINIMVNMNENHLTLTCSQLESNIFVCT